MVNCLKIKARMVECALNQRNLAKAMNLDLSTLNRKINDSTGRFLTVLDAGKLVKILKIENPVEYFFIE